MCDKAEAIETGEQDKPMADVQIEDCGELTGSDKLTEEDADFLSFYKSDTTMDD